LLINQYDIPYDRTFNEMRKRFDKYAGMDLDFAYFRTSFFDAKGNYDTFYRQYMNRNSACITSIEAYSNDFLIYIKRKEIRTLRRGTIPMMQIGRRSNRTPKELPLTP
jgi:hypothetical protein